MKTFATRLFRPGKIQGNSPTHGWTQDVDFLISGTARLYCQNHFTCAEIDMITTGYSNSNDPWKELGKVTASSSMGAIDIKLRKTVVPRACNAAELAAQTATCFTEAKKQAEKLCTAEKVKEDCKKSSKTVVPLAKTVVPRACNAAKLAAQTATCQTEAKKQAEKLCTAEKVKKDCKGFDVTKSCELLHPLIQHYEAREENAVLTEKAKIVDMSNLGIENECVVL